MSDSLQPHGLLPVRLLCPWDFTGKNSEVGCHFLLQGIFPTQGLKLCLLCLRIDRWILYYCTTWEACIIRIDTYKFFGVSPATKFIISSKF